MLELRQSEQRGRAHFGWLKSRHTFSFASYYDPAHMGFSALRVINDDWVAPGTGFDTHGHRDMEILSLVLEGSIEHKDSEGHVEILPAGEFQLMSAGTGIYHSEYNASQTDDLRFLQIWIQPNQRGGKPAYQQKDFGRQAGLTLILSPDGREGSLLVRQDAQLHQLIMSEGDDIRFDYQSDRKVYVHLVAGELDVDGQRLRPGDGAKITEQTAIAFHAQKPVWALVFDLPE